jgi:hypothetical protein
VKLLESIADAFIMTFGITPPKPERRRMASLFIGGALFCVIAAVGGLFVAAILRFLGR